MQPTQPQSQCVDKQEKLNQLLFSNDYRDRFTPETFSLETEAVKERVAHMLIDIWESLDMGDEKEGWISRQLDPIIEYLGGGTYGARLVEYRNSLTAPADPLEIDIGE
jgi:hypothetical protein